jgi:branched-chain amino acid aminotransferase
MRPSVASSEPIIYVNGGFARQSEARISVLDHAVLYGDGVFDTVVAWDGGIFELDAHIDRFFRSLSAIALVCPVTRDELVHLLGEAVRRNGLHNAYIKWIVTRGSNGTPLMDPKDCVPNLIIIALPYIHRFDDARLARGLKLKTAAIRRPPGQVLDPHIKSLNYLNLVMAKLEARAAGAHEALLLDLDGHICEAPGYNVFVLHGQKLRTPAHDILEGVTRATVMDLARKAGLDVEACDLELYDAYTSDELLLCSTAGGVLPAAEIDGRQIGSGEPGPVFKMLDQAYKELLASGTRSTRIDTLSPTMASEEASARR